MHRTFLVTLYGQCNIKCMYMSVLNELYSFPHFNGNFIDNNQALCYANNSYVIIWKYGKRTGNASCQGQCAGACFQSRSEYSSPTAVRPLANLQGGIFRLLCEFFLYDRTSGEARIMRFNNALQALPLPGGPQPAGQLGGLQW